MKPKILITGGCGFSMTNFVRKTIYENKYSIVSLDNLKETSAMNNFYINKDNTFYMADINDAHIIDRIFEYTKPDIVIHAAVEKNNTEKILKTNVIGTQNIIEASEKWGVKKFIYMSSAEVYGGLEKDTSPYNKEASKLNPTNVYLSSKAAGELLLNASKLNYNILRVSKTYGPRQPKKEFIPLIVKALVKNQEISLDESTLQMNDWIHLFDESSAITNVMEYGVSREIYNVSSNQEFTNLEVAHEVCKIMKKDLNQIKFAKSDGNNIRYGTDATKLKELGWKPKYKFKNGIELTIQWFLDNNFLT